VLRVLVDLKVPKVLSEHKGVLELKEIEDLKVHRVQIVSREEQVLREHVDLKVL